MRWSNTGTDEARLLCDVAKGLCILCKHCFATLQENVYIFHESVHKVIDTCTTVLPEACGASMEASETVLNLELPMSNASQANLKESVGLRSCEHEIICLSIRAHAAPRW